MLIIGIAGGTGSGKTTVVQQIINELPETEVGVISQDSYYRDNNNLSFEERALINFDHPRAIDFEWNEKNIKHSPPDQCCEFQSANPIYEHENLIKDIGVVMRSKICVSGVNNILIKNRSVCPCCGDDEYRNNTSRE